MATSRKRSQTPEEELIIYELEQGLDINRIRFLVYGESGVGKTRFASTWPKPLFIDLDDGMASVDIPVHRVGITDFSQLFSLHEYLASAPKEFGTIVIDTLNEAQVLGLTHTVNSYPSIRRPYDSLASQSDYGKMLSDFDDLMRRYKALPIHIVCVTQVTGKEFETDKIIPALIGKNTARQICRMMDEIGYLYLDDNGVPTMSFHLAEYIGKDRSGKLPATIQSPTYPKLAKYWGTVSKTQKRG